MFRVTPIYGSDFDERGPSNYSRCSLIEYGGVSVLWNIGWRENLPELPPHQALIISDSTLGSIGALPLYSQQCAQPAFTTFPTVKMGQMTLYDRHAALCLDGRTPPFTLEQLDTATAALNTIKYSQTITLPDPITGQPALSITAQRAGHVVGGSFFILQRLQDETSVVLASTYHVARELHLDSSTLLKYGATPDVLVTYPGGPAMGQLSQLYGGSTKPLMKQPVVTQAEKTLLETIMVVMQQREGNVLLPVDASGRVLELLLLLSQHWDRQRLGRTFNLCWLGPMTQNTIAFARSQLEWMASPLGAQFDLQRGHPYALKNIDICTSMEGFEKATANGNPTCVLATGASLDHGAARDVLLKWADNQDHAIIFTDSSRCGLRTFSPTETAPDIADDDLAGTRIGPDDIVSEFCAAAQLLEHWCQSKLEGKEMDDVVEVDVFVPNRTPLAGAELKSFLAQEETARLARKKEQERQAMLREVELAKGQLRLGDDDDKNKKLMRTAAKKISPRPKKKSRFDSRLFIKFSKPLHLTFEMREEAVGIGQLDSTAKYGVGESVGRSGEILEDEYGIAVIPEKFTDIVTGVDPSKFAGGSGRLGEDSRRGLGFGADGRPISSSTGGGPAVSASRNVGLEGEQGEDINDENVLEAEDLSEGTGIIRGRGGRPPTKVSPIPRKLEVLAEVNYIPLEGRVDARSARQTIRALQPRQVIVLGGSNLKPDKDAKAMDEVKLLAEAVTAQGVEQCLTPSNDETAELKVGHAAYSVRLIDTPHVIAPDPDAEPPNPVELHEVRLGECSVSRFAFAATGKIVAADGSVVLAPRTCADVRPRRQPSIFVSDGDVLLSDLRAEMTAQGMKAIYSSHAGYSKLVVNEKIVVTKEQDSGSISVEGPLCEDFYAVRQVVCGQFVSL